MFCDEIDKRQESIRRQFTEQITELKCRFVQFTYCVTSNDDILIVKKLFIGAMNLFDEINDTALKGDMYSDFYKIRAKYVNINIIESYEFKLEYEKIHNDINNNKDNSITKIGQYLLLSNQISGLIKERESITDKIKEISKEMDDLIKFMYI
jgi:hypothetical protein